MNERGKYYRPPEDRQVHPGRRAERADSPALAPTISAPALKHENPGTAVEETRKSIGCGAIAALCLGMAASGAVGTFSFLYIAKQGPFADKQMPVPVSTPTDNVDSTTTPPGPEMPDKIRNNNDLKEALKAGKIRATAGDFEYETSRPELQARAIILTPHGLAEGKPDGGLLWLPAKERINRLNQGEFLVAVKVVNPHVGSDISNLIVPEGLSYRAKAPDDRDPSIMYFYYHCEDKPRGQDALLAQLGIHDPVHPKKLMWAKSFHIPSCEQPTP